MVTCSKIIREKAKPVAKLCGKRVNTGLSCGSAQNRPLPSPLGGHRRLFHPSQLSADGNSRPSPLLRVKL